MFNMRGRIVFHFIPFSQKNNLEMNRTRKENFYDQNKFAKFVKCCDEYEVFFFTLPNVLDWIDISCINVKLLVSCFHSKEGKTDEKNLETMTFELKPPNNHTNTEYLFSFRVRKLFNRYRDEVSETFGRHGGQFLWSKYQNDTYASQFGYKFLHLRGSWPSVVNEQQ